MNPAPRFHSEAVGRAGILDLLIPAAAPKDFEFSLWRTCGIGHIPGWIGRIPVEHPLPDIPMHVVKPPGIRPLLADWMRALITVFHRPGILSRLRSCITETVKIGRSR